MTYFKTPSFLEVVKTIWPEVWALSKLFWPMWILIGILLVLVILKLKAEKFIDQKKLEKIKKKCPDCAEWIPREAFKCSHCSKTF